MFDLLSKAVRAVQGLRTEPGWVGIFTRARAPGALANGTKVRKVNSKPNDTHTDGAPGVVLGSFPVTDPATDARYFYFIEWTDQPRIACGIVDFRIAVYREGTDD